MIDYILENESLINLISVVAIIFTMFMQSNEDKLNDGDDLKWFHYLAAIAFCIFGASLLINGIVKGF